MRINKIFDDSATKSLQKQITEASLYLHEKLEKNITKQLLQRILERGYLPILEYPERQQLVMPMSYSQQKDKQINIHTPIPKLILFTKEEYCTKFKAHPDEFDKSIQDMWSRIENNDW